MHIYNQWRNAIRPASVAPERPPSLLSVISCVSRPSWMVPVLRGPKTPLEISPPVCCNVGACISEGVPMSTSPTPSSEPVPAEPTPSRPVLDDKKKAKIIALLANGSSRRMAARYVGCAPSTIHAHAGPRPGIPRTTGGRRTKRRHRRPPRTARRCSKTALLAGCRLAPGTPTPRRLRPPKAGNLHCRGIR